MEKKRLLIADASEEFRMALQESLQGAYMIRACREGSEVLEVLESFKPDVMIVNVMLPGVDGVTVLQRAEARGLRTTVMAMIRFQSDYLLDALERLNVSYVMTKPCEISAIVARLEDILAEKQEKIGEITQPDVCTLVDNALRELSCQPASHGYPPVREALLEVIRHPNQQVTKTLYPAVGKICGGTDKQVEHAIRRMIKKAWLYRSQEVWDRYFGVGNGATVTQCPTNKEFLFTVAAHISEETKTRNTRTRRIG